MVVDRKGSPKSELNQINQSDTFALNQMLWLVKLKILLKNYLKSLYEKNGSLYSLCSCDPIVKSRLGISYPWTLYQLSMDPSGVFYSLHVHSIVLFKEPWSQNNSWTKWTSCN